MNALAAFKMDRSKMINKDVPLGAFCGLNDLSGLLFVSARH